MLGPKKLGLTVRSGVPESCPLPFKLFPITGNHLLTYEFVLEVYVHFFGRGLKNQED